MNIFWVIGAEKKANKKNNKKKTESKYFLYDDDYLSFLSFTSSSLPLLSFSGRQHKMTHKS